MELLIFVLIAVALPLLTVKRKESDTAIFDQKSTTCIKGVLCIFVMIHNLGLDYLAYLDPTKEYNGVLWPVAKVVEHIGGIAVGVFFFISAFGLVKSYQKNGNKFLLKLIFKNMLKLWLVAVGINLLEYLTFFRGGFETTDAVLRILNLDFFNDFNRMNRHGWFIATLLALYVAFAVVFYLTSLLKTPNKTKIACYTMVAIPLLFYLYTAIAQHGGMYSREVWGFSLGVLYAMYYDKINEICDKKFKLLLPLCIVAYLVGVLVQEEVATFATCLLFVAISVRYDYVSPATTYLGKISLGVYLFLHFSTLVLSPYFQANVWYWMLINAGFIFVLSSILYFVIFAVETLLKKLSQCKRTKDA